MDAIYVQGLTKQYPGFTLGPISFSLPEGSILGFVGENGAGKTTAIKSMLGLVRPQGGTVRMLGQETDGKNPQAELALRRQIGVVLNENGFPENLSPLDVERILRELYPTWDSGYYHQLLSRFALPEHKPLKVFSTGMNRKLHLAAALAHRPRLLILDEATSGLDPVVREEMLDLFLEFMEDGAHSILLSSHITSDLDKAADYIALIQKGRLLCWGDKNQLLEQSAVVKCSLEDLRRLPPELVLRWRQNAFGAEALIKDRNALRFLLPQAPLERASIEELMLFYAKGLPGGQKGREGQR